MFDKTIKVQCGESVSVRRHNTLGRIFMDLEIHSDDGPAYVILTPKQARKIAKALRKAAR